MELIKHNVNFDFLGKKKMGFLISLSLIVISLISLILHGGPNYGIDFKGGTVVQLQFSEAVEIGQIRSALNDINLGNSEIKQFGTPSDILIRTELMEAQDNVSDMILNSLRGSFADNEITLGRVETVGAKYGGELIQSAIFSIAIALLCLVIYISWRFQFEFALGAIAALMHDVIITVGIFSLLNKEISTAIVAALLTIVGYSLNDTIVVSDRIRENFKVLRRKDYLEIINTSLNQTLSRTIITSMTTLIVLACLYFFGGEVLKDLALALIIGVTIGTYSSLFVATPIVVQYHEWRESKKKVA